MRSQWTSLSDQQLLAQCAVDTYRASGPGGQKRNKTDSAVRLRHLPSGLHAIAEESRSQHDNKQRALKRLRQRFFLQLREPFPPQDAVAIELWQQIGQHHLKLGQRDARYWPTVGLVLDALAAHHGQLAATAQALHVSTGQLVRFLASNDKVWQQANELRRQFHLHPLRMPC
ncbi:MAG: peptide chain release factor-like protein [Gemmatales bacterium]|nr:peptide chain release factor-like protein [Gemmatales bacterium]MDW7993725.1 peptide chain release factor-like protein [Gemmatales bacterium]